MVEQKTANISPLIAYLHSTEHIGNAEEDFQCEKTCGVFNDSVDVPYHVCTTKAMISENTNLKSELVKLKAFVLKLQSIAVEDRYKITEIEAHQAAVAKREKDVQWQQEDIDTRLAVLKTAENIAFVNTQRADSDMRCASEIQKRSDIDVREAAHIREKYNGLMVGAQNELYRLMQGAPKLGAPQVLRKYGKGSCLFCGYSYCPTNACGVCTTKYMEGEIGEVSKVRAEGILEAVKGAGYTRFQIADIENIPVQMQQLLYSKLC